MKSPMAIAAATVVKTAAARERVGVPGSFKLNRTAPPEARPVINSAIIDHDRTAALREPLVLKGIEVAVAGRKKSTAIAPAHTNTENVERHRVRTRTIITPCYSPIQLWSHSPWAALRKLSERRYAL